jgi:hypothetical protein
VRPAHATGDDDRSARRFRLCGDAGTAVVEFAIIVPLLLLIVFGILDFGRALNYLNDSTHLASAGARWAVVNKAFADLQKWDDNACTTSLQQCIKDNGVTGELRDNATVCIEFGGDAPSNPQIGDPVKVTVDVEFTWLPFIGSEGLGGISSTTMTGSAVMRLEQQPNAYGEGCTS